MEKGYEQVRVCVCLCWEIIHSCWRCHNKDTRAHLSSLLRAEPTPETVKHSYLIQTQTHIHKDYETLQKANAQDRCVHIIQGNSKEYSNRLTR